MQIRLIRGLTGCLLLWGFSLVALAQEEECPDHRLGGYGPYDYTDPQRRQENLPIVEAYHFTPPVARLQRGESGSTIGGDIDYTIRAFPNHHRALDALSRLGYKLKRPQPPGVLCTIGGYFDRAIRFSPRDATLHMVYGIHFSRWGKPNEALDQFKLAETLAPNEPNIQYNLGLAYFDLKDYDRAHDYAAKAYRNGFPPNIVGLKEKLKKVGKWNSAD